MAQSSLFHQDEMHGRIPQDQKHSNEDGEANDIGPHRKSIKTKRAKNRGARHFDVKTKLVINQGQVPNFIYD